VCSPSAAEGDGVARAFETAAPAFERIRTPLLPAIPAPDADGIVRIGPWLVPEGAVACPDAYQIALWKRVR
jgi:hypothetical protein